MASFLKHEAAALFAALFLGTSLVAAAQTSTQSAVKIALIASVSGPFANTGERCFASLCGPLKA